MNRRTIAFLTISITIGIFILGLNVYRGFGQIDLYDLIYWVILAGLCQSFLVVFNKDRYVSVVFAIIFAVQLVYGTYYSVIIAAASQIFFVYKEKPKVYRHIFSAPFYKTLFNITNVTISAYVSGMIFEFFIQKYELGLKTIPYIMLMLLYALVYALFNTGILMLLMSMLTGDRFVKMWRNLISWILPNFLAIAPFGYFVSMLDNQDLGKFYIALLVGPLLLARHSFHLYQKTKMQYYETIKALTAAIEAKDPYTEGHSRRVEGYATQIAKELGLDNAKVEYITVAALLHDIGKIGINDSILNKKGILNENEMSQIRNHPTIGIKILEDVEMPSKSIAMIRHHHERYDGNGYPQGLKGNEIPIEAYILSAADAYDAMTSDRPYRGAMSVNEAIDELIANRGTQFHPDVVDAFVRVIQGNIHLEEETKTDNVN